MRVVACAVGILSLFSWLCPVSLAAGGVEVVSEEVYSNVDAEWGFSASPDASQFTYVDRVMLRSRDVMDHLYVVDAATGAKREVYRAWNLGRFAWIGRNEFYFAVQDTSDLLSRVKHYKDGVVSTVAEGSQFSLSPDGGRIVYRANYGFSERNARIYVANLDGSEQRLLARGHDPVWLKGDVIALNVIENNPDMGGWGGFLKFYRLDGSLIKNLGCSVIPRPSPDRRYLAFDSSCKGDYIKRISVVDVEDPDLKVRVLVEGRPSWVPVDHAWSPGSDALMFEADSLCNVSEGYVEYTSLWVVDLDGNLTELTPGSRDVFRADAVWTEKGILYKRVGGNLPHTVERLIRVVRK